MLIVPAIDLRAGCVVRLQQGDYDRQTRYDADPEALAAQYARGGAQWLHLVDLDGARAGRFENLRVIERIARPATLRVQAGGGVRGVDDVRRLFDAGAERVVVGSMAVRDPDTVAGWLAQFGAARIVIALDVRFDGTDWCLPVDGWTTTQGATLDHMARWYARNGLRHALCTDIARDGMLAGPNLALYAHLRQLSPTLEIIASGGVRGAQDLRELRDTGVAAVVVGRSLLEGRLTLAQALAC